MSSQIESLFEFHVAVEALREAETLLAGVPDWMRELDEEHRAGQAAVDALAAAVEEAGGEHRAAEAVADDARGKLKHFQDQIAQVRNQREYGAILQEIDTVKATIKESEETSLAALERQEEAQGQLDEAREAFKDLDGRHAEALAKWETEKPTVRKEAEQLTGRIEVLRERLSAPALVRYERLAGHVAGSPMSAIRKLERGGKQSQVYHCSSCNYRVRPQAVVEIRNQGNILACESCRRILFIEAEA